MKGWGDVIGSSFDTSKLNIVNRARAGAAAERSSPKGCGTT